MFRSLLQYILLPLTRNGKRDFEGISKEAVSGRLQELP